jgi:hypothetical protein
MIDQLNLSTLVEKPLCVLTILVITDDEMYQNTR